MLYGKQIEDYVAKLSLTDEQKTALVEHLKVFDVRPPVCSIPSWDRCLALGIPVDVLDRAYTAKTGHVPR